MWKRFQSLEEGLLKYGVAALLIVIPLYPKFPLFTVPGTGVAIRAEDFLIALVAMVWLFHEARTRFEFLKDNLNKIILAYFLIGFISFVSAVFITQTVIPYIALLHTVRRVEYMIVLFIMVASVKSIKEIIFYLQVILLTLLLVFLYGIGQKFFYLPVISTMNVEFAKGIALRLHAGERLSSTFAGHYDLAAYLVLLLPLSVSLIVGAKKRFHKIVILVISLCEFWLLLASASRISFFAYLASISFTLWFLKRRVWIVPVVALSIFASFFVPQLSTRYENTIRAALIKVKEIKIMLPGNKQPIIISFLPEVTPTPLPSVPAGKPTGPVGTVQEIPTPTPIPGEKRYIFYGAGPEMPQTEDRSTAIRLKVEWPRALRALAKNPFLGTGFSSITLATDNDYLRTLGEIGILGFWVFSLIFVVIGLRARRFLFTKKLEGLQEILIIGITGSIMGFLLNALFIDVFEASKVAIIFWLLVGLMISALRLSRKESYVGNK